MAGIGGVGAYTLADAAEFIGVGAVPDIFLGRMLQGLTGGGIKEGEGPVVDDVGWILAACS